MTTSLTPKPQMFSVAPGAQESLRDLGDLGGLQQNNKEHEYLEDLNYRDEEELPKKLEGLRSVPSDPLSPVPNGESEYRPGGQLR
ncbi:hypothetical protein EYF80_036443 [Liparis tanakae]|uniref:Uncharacterized protein n=1 Tax=Liparis tanakae TaxID=230148 RepID=A0A4Z2GIV0_9TELE|nr:hypothetical protein EYF80_036443 [Liparis tanakae]